MTAALRKLGGRPLRVDDVGPVEAWVDRHAGLRGSAKDVLRAIAWYADRYDEPRPSVEQLAEPPQGQEVSWPASPRRCGWSKRTVQRRLPELVDAGLLAIVTGGGRLPGGLGVAHVYRICVPKKGANLALVPPPGTSDDPTRTAVEAAETAQDGRSGATLAPQVVSSCSWEPERPPSPANDDERAAASGVGAESLPSAGADAPAKSAAGWVTGWRCPHARRRGRLCANCRKCGTSRRAIEKRERREREAADRAARLAAPPPPPGTPPTAVPDYALERQRAVERIRAARAAAAPPVITAVKRSAPPGAAGRDVDPDPREDPTP